jgi:hypothetical protein
VGRQQPAKLRRFEIKKIVKFNRNFYLNFNFKKIKLFI